MTATPSVDIGRGLRRGDLVDVTIARLVKGGLGEADVDVIVGPERELRRYVVAVRKAVVGDHVRVWLEGRKRRRVVGRIDTLLTPSPDRVAARCRHFGQREEPGQGCGGCTQQPLRYDAQLRAKRALVQRAFAAQGMDPERVAPVIGADPPWRYRNKMELSFGDDRARRFALGLYPSGWHNEVLSLQECHLMSEPGAALIPAMRAWAETQGLAAYRARDNTGFLRQLVIREGKRTDERLVELVTTGATTTPTADGELPASQVAERFAAAVLAAGASVGGPVTAVFWTQHVAETGHRTRMVTHHLAGDTVYHEVLVLPGGRELRFAIHPRAFFQPNPRQAEVLCAEVLARLGAAKTVVDLYCGTGTLGLCVAPFVSRVIGIERVAEAVDNARANATANGLEHLSYLVGDVADVLASPAFDDARGAVDAVLVDPPRAGLGERAVAQVLALEAQRIVYVSCNPVSLARDLGGLLAGGYAIDGAIQPVDMFPQTHHVECVVALARVDSSARA